MNAGKLKLCLIRFSTDSKISIPRNNNTHITQINNLFRVSDQTAAEYGIAFWGNQYYFTSLHFSLFLMNVYSCKLQVNCKKVVDFFLNTIRSLYMMIWYSANCNLNYVPLRVRLIFVELMIHQQMTIKS